VIQAIENQFAETEHVDALRSLSDLASLIGSAIDQIYALRGAMATEAVYIRGHLSYKTFPKSRRDFTSEQIERMFLAARGNVELAYAGQFHHSMNGAMSRAGAQPVLARGSWIDAQTLRLFTSSTWLDTAGIDKAAISAAQAETYLEYALNEINGLQRGLAYEASVLSAHRGCTSFPIGPYRVIVGQIERMRLAARGEVASAYAGPQSSLKPDLETADANQTLTNQQWLTEIQARYLPTRRPPVQIKSTDLDTTPDETCRLCRGGGRIAVGRAGVNPPKETCPECLGRRLVGPDHNYQDDTV
jgi:hypothetical protein